MRLKKYFLLFINFIRDYLFRKKTLNYLLWLLIVAILAQLHAINNYDAIQAIFTELQKDYDSIWLKYLILVIEFFVGDASVFVLSTLIVLFLIICYLKYKEIKAVNGLGSSEDFKNELLHSLVDTISKAQKIDSEAYISAIHIINNKALKAKLKTYHNFERKRGNVHLLEKFVVDSNLIDDLKKHSH
ncbi:hypothetical protein [Olleya sp. ITB9]|uniref:hypothetical protein n=1 Tax=Olleya sp. ITB9 TaxID=1715648 RepID=UPI000A8971B4|nr:hypothetical protein [Olleya sp. ITB9]